MLSKRLREIEVQISKGDLQGYIDLISLSNFTRDNIHLFSTKQMQEVLNLVIEVDWKICAELIEEKNFNLIF